MNKSLWQYWILHALLIILSVYFYIFTEWLFFVTKPSFMSVLDFKDTFLILLVSPLPLVLAGLTALFICWVFSRFLNNVMYQSVCIAMSRIIPALILSVSIFLLIDNFTYTVFRFGVISTKGLWGLSYLLLFLIILSYVYYWLFRKEKLAASSSLSRKKIISVISLPAISLIGLIAVHNYTVFDYGHKGIIPEHQSMQNIGPGDLDGNNKKNSIESSVKRPHILLIATDGLDAERMSVYGYERNTTPYIKEFTEGTSLFCENAFSNATISAPSIVSMLTGKLPTDTKLYYPPDILRGDDAYQHLPAILRSYGYRNIDFGIRYYADAYDLNMLNSFNESNFRKPDKLERISFPSSVFDNNTRYFFNLLMERLETRFLLMTCQKEIINPYDVVTGKEVISYSNEFVLKRFLNFIDESNAPFFAHIHLMGMDRSFISGTLSFPRDRNRQVL
ncbi:MAG: sulfatase-like hydrolase/transferase [Deltaproteobacteria bacterium]|nr:sulfatase-like hydrolase/transferase [Deltaproteobacteria bacterium]